MFDDVFLSRDNFVDNYAERRYRSDTASLDGELALVPRSFLLQIRSLTELADTLSMSRKCYCKI